jgi:branched-chain amino acid transport system ATP-binding protein
VPPGRARPPRPPAPAPPPLAEQGVAVLLVEQNLKLAAVVADRVFVMLKGRVVYDATPERFRAEEAEIRSRYLTL